MKKEPLKNSQAENADVVFLKQLLETKGWKIVEKHLKENLDYLTEKILDDTDSSLSETITLSKRELLVKWRKYNDLLFHLPERMIESLKSGEPIEAPSDLGDPYEQEPK